MSKSILICQNTQTKPMVLRARAKSQLWQVVFRNVNFAMKCKVLTQICSRQRHLFSNFMPLEITCLALRCTIIYLITVLKVKSIIEQIKNCYNIKPNNDKNIYLLNSHAIMKLCDYFGFYATLLAENN